MRKYKLLFIAFAFGLFMLTACNNQSSTSNSNNNSSEVDNSSESEKSDNESKTEDESKDKIKDDGTLDDGIEWGPLED